MQNTRSIALEGKIPAHAPVLPTVTICVECTHYYYPQETCKAVIVKEYVNFVTGKTHTQWKSCDEINTAGHCKLFCSLPVKPTGWLRVVLERLRGND